MMAHLVMMQFISILTSESAHAQQMTTGFAVQAS